jgi:hypothetical protein
MEGEVRMTRFAALTAVLAVLMAECGVAANSVPFTEDFESGYVNGNAITNLHGWTGSGADMAWVTNTAQYPGSGGTLGGFVAAGGSVTNTFTTTSNRIWVIFQTKMSYWQEAAMPSVDSNATVQFCVNTNSRITLFNGPTDSGGWQVKTNDVLGSALPTDISNTWVRLAILCNYVTHQSAILINSNVAAQTVGFVSNKNTFTQFVVGNGDARFDDLLITNSVPIAQLGAVDSDVDGLPDVWELHYLGRISGAGAGPGDDPDADGFNNLREYQWGADPSDPLSHPPPMGTLFLLMGQ